MFCYDVFLRVPDIKKTGSGLIDKIVSDKRSLKNLQLAELGDQQDGMYVILICCGLRDHAGWRLFTKPLHIIHT